MSSENQLTEHLEGIWDNWRDHTGNCRGCSHWGTGGGNAPFYGVGNLEAEVVLIAKEPGAASDPANPQWTEDLDTHHDEIYNYIQSEYDSHLDRQSDIRKTGMYEEYSDFVPTFIDPLLDNNIGIYYTNLKKCREKSSSGEEELQKAINCCGSYLKTELEILSPNVIVTFGNEATKWIYDYYPELYDEYDISMTKDEMPASAGGIMSENQMVREINDTVIIPSTHFSARNIPNFGSKKQMVTNFQELAEIIIRSCASTHTSPSE
mgnify:CR=1 FL=1